MVINKKVTLQLVGLDSNAFAILGTFAHAARQQGWTKEEIMAVRTEAMSENYDHLLVTISDHCQSED